MKTTHPHRLIIGVLGLGLLGYICYLGSHNGATASAVPAAPGASAISTLASLDQSDPEENSDRNMTWGEVEPSLFSPSLPSPPLLVLAAQKPVPPPDPQPPFALIPVLPLPDPLEGYTYTGTVMLEGELSALIEHKGNKLGWYVRNGEPWQAYRIVEVTRQAVTVLVMGKKYLLPKSDVINLVPLMENADRGGASSGKKALMSSGQGDTPQNAPGVGVAQTLTPALSQIANAQGVQFLTSDLGGQGINVTINPEASSVNSALLEAFSAVSISIEVPAETPR